MNILVGMSIYHKHLSTLWEIFPQKNRFNFIVWRSQNKMLREFCKKLFSFCNVDDTFSPEVSKLYERHERNSISFNFRWFADYCAIKIPWKKRTFTYAGNVDYKVGEACANNQQNKQTSGRNVERMREFLVEYFNHLMLNLKKWSVAIFHIGTSKKNRIRNRSEKEIKPRTE